MITQNSSETTDCHIEIDWQSPIKEKRKYTAFEVVVELRASKMMAPIYPELFLTNEKPSNTISKGSDFMKEDDLVG